MEVSGNLGREKVKLRHFGSETKLIFYLRTALKTMTIITGDQSGQSIVLHAVFQRSESHTASNGG